MDAAWAVLAGVVVTQAVTASVQWRSAVRTDRAAAKARTDASDQADKQRQHELDTRRLELDAAAFQTLRVERVVACGALSREAWKLARAGGLRHPALMDVSGAGKLAAAMPTEEARLAAEEQVARTNEALWTVQQLGGTDVANSAAALVDYLVAWVHAVPDRVEVRDLMAAFNTAVRAELAGMVGTRSL